MLLEELEDVVGRVECNLAGESIGQDSHPNHDGSDNDCPIQGDLGVNVLDVLVILFFMVLDVLVFMDILILLNPSETNKIDRRMLDASLVEESNNLGTNASQSQIAALQEGHEPWSE